MVAMSNLAVHDLLDLPRAFFPNVFIGRHAIEGRKHVSHHSEILCFFLQFSRL
jgi:hypothetical protein